MVIFRGHVVGRKDAADADIGNKVIKNILSGNNGTEYEEDAFVVCNFEIGQKI
jgi:hypothetical protein